MSTYLTAAALFFAFLVYGLDRFGYLPKRRSLADAVAELEIREHTIDRLRLERNKALLVAARLENERSNAPVLELVAKVVGICEQTLEKLASFNGSLAHIEEGLAETREGLRETRDGLHLTVEGMKALTGTICELHDLPLREPNR